MTMTLTSEQIKNAEQPIKIEAKTNIALVKVFCPYCSKMFIAESVGKAYQKVGGHMVAGHEFPAYNNKKESELDDRGDSEQIGE